ncbi:hypothetical protein [Demequina aestuarii]|uniref:hypothetical protein n=1 Tax=Demequina aestuarii TaxID=327095 RepID=UPI000781FCBC|nr:hypothetical protein [Demequina aestuarii]
MTNKAMDAEVASYVSRGYGVESRTRSQVVLVRTRRMGWFWNSILVLLTGGLWLIYVIYRLANRKVDRIVLTSAGRGAFRRSKG